MSSVMSVALAIAHKDGDPGLLRDAAKRLAGAGGAMGWRSERAIGVHRLDGRVGDLLFAAARLLREPAMSVLSAGGVIAVKVLSCGVALPSEQSVRMADELAADAPAGRVILSLRMASLLQLAEPALAALLRPLNVMTAAGAPRAVMWLDPHAPADEIASADAHRSAALAALDPHRRAQLIDRLSARLLPDLGPIAPMLLANLCDRSRDIDTLVQGLRPYLSMHGTTRATQVIGEELANLARRA